MPWSGPGVSDRVFWGRQTQLHICLEVCEHVCLCECVYAIFFQISFCSSALK